MHMAMLTRAVGPFAGVGLFTGVRSSLRFLPAAKDTGIRVQRLGFDQVATQRALVTHVVSDSAWAGPAAPLVRNTTLMVSAEPAGASAKDASKVAATIEHAMAALAGLHVWDAVIEIDAAEVPILDGSARAFVEGLREAVVVGEAGDEPQPIVLTRRVEVREKDASIVAEPVASMRDAIMTYNLDFAGRGSVGAQTYSWRGDSDVFVGEIAAARTFGFRSEVEYARRAGQFAWLSEREMVVFDDTPAKAGVSVPLRFTDEPARHKLLDLIGDLALLGAPLQARVMASKSGHALTHALCREIVAEARAK